MTLRLLFERQKKEVLNNLRRGKRIANDFLLHNEFCEHFSSDKIDIIRIYRGDKTSDVIIFHIREITTRKEYVMRLEKEYIDKLTYTGSSLTLKEYAEQLPYASNSDYVDMIVKINGGDENKIIRNGDKINDFYQTKCLRGIHGELIENICAIYLCDQSIYINYLITLYCSEFYKKGNSIHFMDEVFYSFCEIEKDKFYHTLITPKYLGDMYDALLYVTFTRNNSLSDKERHEFNFYILIQILHSIAVMQKSMISHNDLHVGNVLLERITASTIYNGKRLMDADYFHYKLGDTDLYIPKIPYIAKIMDFEYSVKYSSPVVGNSESLVSINRPEFFSPAYDVLLIVSDFYFLDENNKLISKLLSWMINSYSYTETLNTENLYRYFYFPKNYHHTPKLRTLRTEFNFLSAENVLKCNHFFGKYYKTPKSNKIITLGLI